MVKVLFDTSVLVAALIEGHPSHSVCFPRLKAAELNQVHGFISTHSLAELYAVITRLPLQPRISPKEAQTSILAVVQYLEPVPLLSEDYLTTIDRMATLSFTGGSVFDALIAEAALKKTVDIILTLNPNHFTRLGDPIAALVQVPV